jgi:hypothetical protein
VLRRSRETCMGLLAMCSSWLSMHLT